MIHPFEFFAKQKVISPGSKKPSRQIFSAEQKTVTATNGTDNIQLNTSTPVEFQPGSAARIVWVDGNEQMAVVGRVRTLVQLFRAMVCGKARAA